MSEAGEPPTREADPAVAAPGDSPPGPSGRPPSEPGSGEVRILERRRLHRTAIFELIRERVRLPSGLEQDVVVVDHPGAVCIAALRDDGRLLVVRQYRHAAGRWLVEIPAGRLEPGENPLTAARRELEEETGHRAARWEHLRSFFPAPGFCSERLELFLARDLEPIAGGGLPPDPDEELEVLARTPAELVAESEDAKTLVAALLLASR